MDLRHKFKFPYYQRWINDAEIFMCHVELDSLQMCIPHAFDVLYREDRDSPCYENLYTGFILRQINQLLMRLNNQKKFLSNPEDQLQRVKLPLAFLPVFHFLISSTKQNHLVRLRGNIEIVLQKYGYEFEEVKPVREIDAWIEDIKREQSEWDEFKMKISKP